MTVNCAIIISCKAYTYHIIMVLQTSNWPVLCTNCVLYRTAYYCMLKGLLLAYNIHVVVLGFFRIGFWSKTVIIIIHGF